MSGDLAKDVFSDLRKGFESGRTIPVEFRLAQLFKLHDMIAENTDQILEALHNDMKKPKAEALVTEIDMVKNEIADYTNNLSSWLKPKHVSKPLVNKMDSCYVQYDPYGVVLIIGAWNYPIQLTIIPLIGAIAAGNCAIVKPSEVSEHTATLLAALIPCYLDQQCYRVVNGGVATTTELLNEKSDYIFYTGNSSVGRVIMQAAAKNLTPVTLELGGKCPAYIDSSVSLTMACTRLCWAKFLNAGQTCLAPDYVFCHESVYDDFIAGMKATIEQFYGKEPSKSADFTRIVNARHFQRISGLLEGVTVEYGGDTDAETNYISPTIVTQPPDDHIIMKEEIFGPVMPVLKVSNPSDVIKQINRKDKPLAIYVFSNNKSVIEQFSKRTSSGSFCANDAVVHAGINTMPFGGVGNSGLGGYHGKFTLETFSHKKSCVVKATADETVNLKVRYPPYTDSKLSWLRWLMKKSPKSVPSSPLITMFLMAAAIVSLIGAVLHGTAEG